MKKLSLILTLALAASLVFGVAANAADCSKSKLISDLKVFSNGADDWEVDPQVNVGTKTYTDRNFFIQTIPEDYIGCEYLRPACNSKNYVRTDTPLATFKALADFELYIAYDQRVVAKPQWFKEFGATETGATVVDTATNPQVTYDIFKKSIKAGTNVELGVNGQSGGCIQYIVMMKGSNWQKGAVAAASAVDIPVELNWNNILAMKADWYGTQEAIDVADNVLAYQYNNGGWYKNIDMAVKMNKAQRYIIAQDKALETHSTIDNNATTTQIQFLARVYSATKEARFKDSFDRGMNFLFAAQYPNGGWPQYYPKFEEAYFQRITFNDNAMNNVMMLMENVAAGKAEFAFVDAALKAKAKASYDKGLDCILKCQVKINGSLTVWGAQHDEKTLAPAKARSYELPSLCSSESVSLVKLLMAIENPSKEIVDSIKAAVKWFEANKINGVVLERQPNPSLNKGYDNIVVARADAPGMWARFYDLETGKPFFCGRDGIKKATLAEIEHERRIGYSWYSNTPAVLIAKDYKEWCKKNNIQE